MATNEDILAFAKVKTKVNAVPNLSAQSIKLCQDRNDMLTTLNNVCFCIINDKDQRYLERVALDLMLSAGLRVSECVGSEKLKVNALGQVYITGSKGSDPKLVTPLYFRNFWLKRVGIHTSPFLHISRFIMYKYMKRNEVIIPSTGDKNSKVTHSLRNLHVYLMQLIEIPSEEMSSILGHKSFSNIKYYLHGK